MKTKIVVVSLLFVWTVAVALTLVLPSNKFTLAWDYPTVGISPDLYFNLYSSTNIIDPPQTWTRTASLQANGTNLTVVVNGTNTTFFYSNNVAIAATRYFFATSTNFYGESLPSNTVTSSPALMPLGTNMIIMRQP